MVTLRCTAKLLDRLGVRHDADSDATPGNALGDWYANLIRVGREQLVVVMNERTYLTLVLPARGIRDSIHPGIVRALAELLRELAVPEAAIQREIGQMHPMAFARTASRSVVGAMNERAHLIEHLWKDDRPLADIVTWLARLPMTSGPSEADLYPSRAARRLLGLDPMPAPPATVIRLHVSLEDLAPAIWRRVIVPDSITLPRLHRVLQVAMGWEDYHLHEFDFGGARYGIPDDDHLDAGLRGEKGMVVGDIVRTTGIDRFTYIYDYGDDWRHRVVVEAVEPNSAGFRWPRCTDGANRCPPEDVGGTGGYLEFLQALRDPTHALHRDMAAWGGPFDPTAFDSSVRDAMLQVEFG